MPYRRANPFRYQLVCLQEGLVSTGKFYAGEAVLMIEHMEKTDKIEKTEQYNVYRIGKSITTREEGWNNMQ
jgi:hypothetical protein